MKKVLLFLLLILVLAPLTAESGRWVFEPLFTRLPDGTLISSGMEYSAPFAGFEEIHYIDDYLARVIIDGGEFRAFYDSFTGDAGNRRITLIFRDSSTLDVQIVPVSGFEGGNEKPDYLFYYELPAGFFDVSDSNDDEDDFEPETAGTAEDMEENPKKDLSEEDLLTDEGQEEEAEEPEIWSISGYLREYP